jgi:hypothetical protein
MHNQRPEEATALMIVLCRLETAAMADPRRLSRSTRGTTAARCPSLVCRYIRAVCVMAALLLLLTALTASPQVACPCPYRSDAPHLYIYAYHPSLHRRRPPPLPCSAASCQAAQSLVLVPRCQLPVRRPPSPRAQEPNPRAKRPEKKGGRTDERT